MDNVGYTPGEGASIAADEVDGVLYQRVKQAFGADGEATDVSEENPLPVSMPGAATEETLAALKSAADAIKAAAEALNTKAIALNTGDVAGTVELGAASLAALETVAVGNLPETQPISAAELPLPDGAATDAKVDALISAMAALLAELQLKPDAADLLRVSQEDISMIERVALKAMARLTFTRTGQRVDCSGSSVTASLASNQTLGTVTTVGSANNVALGRLSTSGQSILLSRLNYSNGFRARLG